MKRGKNHRKKQKTIQVIQKDLKLAKSAIKSAESSIYLHSDSFKINAGKSQVVNIDCAGSSLNKFKVSIMQN